MQIQQNEQVIDQLITSVIKEIGPNTQLSEDLASYKVFVSAAPVMYEDQVSGEVKGGMGTYFDFERLMPENNMQYVFNHSQYLEDMFTSIDTWHNC